MRSLLLVLFSLILLNIHAQSDTTEISALELADSVYHNLSDLNTAPTGRLFNRIFIDKDSSYSFKYSSRSTDTIDADSYYRLINELRYMSLDTAKFITTYEAYIESQKTFAKFDFDDDLTVIPLSILDIDFNSIDEEKFKLEGQVNQSNLVFSKTTKFESDSVTRNVIQVVAPSFDLVYDTEMFFKINDSLLITHDSASVNSVMIYQGRRWVEFSKSGLIPIEVKNDSVQYSHVKVILSNGDTIQSTIKLNTPNSGAFSKSDKLECDRGDEIEINKNKLQWCLLNGCNKTNGEVFINKPYILVTGFRPPFLGQSFNKTYEKYNQEHAALINELQANDYDVILVKFNIHNRPQKHGIIESAELLEKFIQQVNAEKLVHNSDYENIIQGSSMGADIVRLTLMNMEHKHQNDNTYRHHHTRLFLSYDANYHGANVPLSYQYLMYSMYFHQDPVVLSTGNVSVPFFGSVSVGGFLMQYLYATLKQKVTKQLLKYHAINPNNNQSFPYDPHATLELEPTSHYYYDQFVNYHLAQVNTYSSFVPLPYSTRNIAVSLGKISGTNDEEDDPNNVFYTPDESWRDVENASVQFFMKPAKYTTSGYTKIFHRRSFYGYLGVPFVFTNQSARVKNMQEVDNAAGSYLNSLGNVIALSDAAYFGIPFNNYKRKFTHKPVLTSLSIHQNEWPADGSFSLDIQDLGLMFVDRNQTSIPDDYNDFYGYPNVGRPGDHFSITPFEAIYVDNEIDPHVNLSESDAFNKLQLKDFIINEVEPEILGLQNQNFGSQARSNYLYKGKYRAKKEIRVGDEVTNRTDIGPFTIEENAFVEMRAGQKIHLKPGFKAEYGCYYHGKIDYEQCNSLKSNPTPDDSVNPLGHSVQQNQEVEPKDKEDLFTPEHRASQWRVYPNPSRGSFKILNTDNRTPDEVMVYSVSGRLIYRSVHFENGNDIEYTFSDGVYLVKIKKDNNVITKKVVVI